MEKCKHVLMNYMPAQEYGTPEQIGQSHVALAAHGTTSVSAFRVALSLAMLGLVLLLVGYLADWSQLKSAVRQLGGQPWLLVILVVAYTGAFLLRAIAWRVFHRVARAYTTCCVYSIRTWESSGSR